MLRPCITCGVLITRGSYCRRHIKRGSSGKQATFRRKTLAQTGGKCAVCGSVHGVQAHHPHPVAEGGGGAAVGQPLCIRCHRQAHR
jgi:5-methylcytosine-specific restriction endonuclease McrA